VPAKQMLALDTNTNAIAATAGLFIDVDNKDVLIVSCPFNKNGRVTPKQIQ
jgi:hypothetical protein